MVVGLKITLAILLFFTQSEPVSPQAAQLGIHFSIFFYNTQLEMHLL